MMPLVRGLPFAPHPVDSYSIVIVLAVLVGWACTLGWARQAGMPVGRVALATTIVSVISLASARLHFVLNTGKAFVPAGVSPLGLLGAGAHAGGGIIAFAVGAPLVARAIGLPVRRLADVSAPAAVASIAVARLGCLARGCCLGITCGAPWCAPYPRQSFAFLLHADRGLVAPDAPASAPVHLLPVYFAVAALGIAVAGRWLDRRRRYDGQVALVCFALFSTSTWGLELLRENVPGRAYWGTIPQLTWTAALLTCAALFALGIAELGTTTRPSRSE